jgi:hypothetical protein
LIKESRSSTKAGCLRALHRRCIHFHFHPAVHDAQARLGACCERGSPTWNHPSRLSDTCWTLRKKHDKITKRNLEGTSSNK